MRVFISWSGTFSHEIATLLHDWLPNVLQYVEPFLSSEDIDKGMTWFSTMTTELQGCHFGLICLTPDNLTAPWIHFEAGSLSKLVDRSRVMPILFRLKPSDVQGPLTHFQMVDFGKEEVLRLLKSINNIAGERKIDEDRLKKVFERFWNDLDRGIAAVQPVPHKKPGTTPAVSLEIIQPILEEILVLVRQQAMTAADTLPFIVGSLQGNVGVLRDILTPYRKVMIEQAQRMEQFSAEWTRFVLMWFEHREKLVEIGMALEKWKSLDELVALLDYEMIDLLPRAHARAHAKV